MARRKVTPKTGDWVVTITATVTKVIQCMDCTKEEARSDPYKRASYIEEIGLENYTVTKVEPY